MKQIKNRKILCVLLIAVICTLIVSPLFVVAEPTTLIIGDNKVPYSQRASILNPASECSGSRYPCYTISDAGVVVGVNQPILGNAGPPILHLENHRSLWQQGATIRSDGYVQDSSGNLYTADGAYQLQKNTDNTYTLQTTDGRAVAGVGPINLGQVSSIHSIGSDTASVPVITYSTPQGSIYNVGGVQMSQDQYRETFGPSPSPTQGVTVDSSGGTTTIQIGEENKAGSRTISYGTDKRGVTTYTQIIYGETEVINLDQSLERKSLPGGIVLERPFARNVEGDFRWKVSSETINGDYEIDESKDNVFSFLDPNDPTKEVALVQIDPITHRTVIRSDYSDRSTASAQRIQTYSNGGYIDQRFAPGSDRSILSDSGVQYIDGQRVEFSSTRDPSTGVMKRSWRDSSHPNEPVGFSTIDLGSDIEDDSDDTATHYFFNDNGGVVKVDSVDQLHEEGAKGGTPITAQKLSTWREALEYTTTPDTATLSEVETETGCVGANACLDVVRLLSTGAQARKTAVAKRKAKERGEAFVAGVGESLSVFSQVSSQFGRGKPLSNLIFGDIYSRELSADIDRWFAGTVLSENYYESAVCAAVTQHPADVQDDGYAFVETPYGTFQAIGYIASDKGPETPLLCDIEAEELCPDNFECVDNFCYDGNEIVQSHLYRISWGVSAPADEALTPYSDENGYAVSYNVVLCIDENTCDTPLYEYQGNNVNPLKLTNGNRDGQTHVAWSNHEYAIACIDWTDAPITIDYWAATGNSAGLPTSGRPSGTQGSSGVPLQDICVPVKIVEKTTVGGIRILGDHDAASSTDGATTTTGGNVAATDPNTLSSDVTTNQI